MSQLQIALPPKLIPVFQGRADVRGAYGGRGSGKTRSFAKMAAVQGMRFGQAGIKGQILCARQFMNSLDDSSLEEVKRAIEDEPALSAYWSVGEKFVKSRDGNVWFSFAGLDRNIGSVKSKGRILLCWVDEAEPVTAYAWDTLIPTLREEGDDWNAETWVTWNPARKSAPVERFRQTGNPLVKVVELNYRDNPRFPALLERKRLSDQEERPDQYPHIWDGEYLTAVSGAYYAKALSDAKKGARIGDLARDPLMTTRAYWDIGGTGAKADACAIWIVQFVGQVVRVLDYYEAIGQELAVHVEWLRRSGYEAAACILPHDGANHDKVFKVSYESSLKAAGFQVRVVPNMGAGAAMNRIEATRRLFPSIWFNEKTTESGRDALGWYHEKRDDQRNIGFGPNHDWASHAADAFGLMAVDHAAGDRNAPKPVRLNFSSEFA
ncbi:phage terminase large subunit [Pseudoxanthomonas sp. USHLN014]|uniref:phage terminase large subunit n=1 Tax=Pseudoxanthomonas sp. USHLN014 TaxID=3081297 RepID=UPI00301E52D2